MKANRKNKPWTYEEETALLTGVTKHGVGKWKKIRIDPEFANKLVDRTNIDLKDKWRNIEKSEAKTLESASVFIPSADTSPLVSNESSPNSSSDKNDEYSDENGSDLSEIKDKSETQTLESDSISPEMTFPVVGNEPSPNSSSDTNNESRFAIFGDSSDCYDAMVFEALLTINDQNGSDVSEIVSFIEERHEVSKNFRGLLIYSLANLVSQHKLEKVLNRYKISTTKARKSKLTLHPKDSTKPPELPSTSVILTTSKETQEIDAAANKIVEEIDKLAKENRGQNFRKLVSECLEILVSEGNLEKGLDCYTISELVNKVLEVEPEVVAKIVAEADNELAIAEDAAEEAERMNKLVEESQTMLQLSLEIHEQCVLGLEFFLP